MSLSYPHFLVNFKVYEGTAGAAGRDLAETIERVAERTGASFAVAPQTPDLYRVASVTSLPVVAQSVDTADPGRGTGAVSLQSVASAGAEGVLINHAESPDTLAEIESLVAGCADHDLESIVSVSSVEMGRAALAFGPDCLLFENPGDIATGQPLASADPDRVRDVVAMVGTTAPDTRVLLGGGISDAGDVEASLALGADAAGAASAFLDASDRESWLESIAEVLVDADEGR